MPGMLTEGQGPQQQQSSGPVLETPPAGASPTSSSPGPGQPPPEAAPQGEATGSYVELRDEAISLIYGERMNELAGMFIEAGPDGFPMAMSTAVNTAITELEKKHGKIPYEMAAQIGLGLYIRLLEDFVGEGIVKGITAEHMQEALPAILMGYQKTHPEVTPEELQQVMLTAGKHIHEGGGEPRDVPGIDTPLPEGQTFGQAAQAMWEGGAPSQGAPGGPAGRPQADTAVASDRTAEAGDAMNKLAENQ